MPFTFPDFLAQAFMIRTISQAYLKFVNPPAWSLYVEALFLHSAASMGRRLSQACVSGGNASFVVFLIVEPLASRELWLWKYFFLGIIISEVYDNHSAWINEKTARSLTLLGIVSSPSTLWVQRLNWFNC
jgi:hypothetical protein